jgi:hypothetical protein
VLFNRFSIDLGNDAALSALPTDKRVARNMATFDPGLVSLFVNLGRSLLIGSSQVRFAMSHSFSRRILMLFQ